jgi:lysophospholipase L1-like esterase
MRESPLSNIRRGIAAAIIGLLVAGCAATPAKAPAPMQPNAFESAIVAFEQADAAKRPKPCSTLFVGSSSIRFWASLAEDFPERSVINRGFGGSTIADVNYFFSRIVPPYSPKEIVFYAGENDLNAGKAPEAVFADFKAFMDLKSKSLGATPVWFVSAKPSKLRLAQLPAQTRLNEMVEDMARKRKDLAFIDVVKVMMTPEGAPKDIFVADNLHMTPAGYALWTPVVKAALDAGQDSKAPGC